MTVSVFEICIRFLGGMLTAFALTGDEVQFGYKLSMLKLNLHVFLVSVFVASFKLNVFFLGF